MTSSVNWPFDSPYPISYWFSQSWPSLYPKQFSRYWSSKCLSCTNRQYASAIWRHLCPLSKIWIHIWISHPDIAYSLLYFYWTPIKNKGCLLFRPPILNVKSDKNFQFQQNGTNFGGFEDLESGVSEKFQFFYSKIHICTRIHTD